MERRFGAWIGGSILASLVSYIFQSVMDVPSYSLLTKYKDKI